MAAVTAEAAEYLSIDSEELARLCEQYGVIELAVFGSTVRRENRPDSDVDLLYTLAADSDLGWTIEELNGRLAEALGRPVDLVSKRYLHKMLREQILSEAVVVYAA
jgi:uncharacterized protein